MSDVTGTPSEKSSLLAFAPDSSKSLSLGGHKGLIL